MGKAALIFCQDSLFHFYLRSEFDFLCRVCGVGAENRSDTLVFRSPVGKPDAAGRGALAFLGVLAWDWYSKAVSRSVFVRCSRPA